ncbi:MAG: hypothetical protein Q8O67_14870 [Deltaproteobacteria bacterium]|nr:hypothetical protein [Deltaproteobacteria bacterium]
MSPGVALLLVLAPFSIGSVDNEPGPSGLALSAAVVGGVVGGDGVIGLTLGAGIESAPFALHLKAPVLLRLIDSAPVVDAALPSFCGLVRCEELLAGEELDPTAIARLLDELRVFEPGDVFHLRAGGLVATLGSGAVVDRFTTAASWDRRTSGAFAALRLPWHRLRADVVVADVVSPGELLAARIEAEPLDELALRIALDSGVDLFAPIDLVDRNGALPAGSVTRPLTSTSLSAGYALLEGTIDLLPRLELMATTGLSSDGGRAWSFDKGGLGAGAGAGVDVGVDLDVVDARFRLTGTLGTAGQRRGLFSTLYLVERRAALVGASVDGGGIARVPAPPGAGLDARLEASVFDVVVPLVRLHLEPAPGANAAEAGVVVDVEPVSVSLSLLRRGFSGVDVVGLDLERQPLVGALQASWRFWGPLSLSLRWLRLPRFQSSRQSSQPGLRVDDDVLVSLSANTILVPQ